MNQRLRPKVRARIQPPMLRGGQTRARRAKRLFAFAGVSCPSRAVNIEQLNKACEHLQLRHSNYPSGEGLRVISYTTTYRAPEQGRGGECEVSRGWREGSGRGEREREGGVTKRERERDRDKVEES